MSRWNRQLQNYNSLLGQIKNKIEKGEGELRFNSPFVKASDIARQYFCEKKVEMEHLIGEIQTERRIIGKKAHEKLLEDAIKIKRRDLWKDLYGNKLVLAPEMLLLTTYKDVVLVGRPDSILFMKGSPLIIFEYKFSRNPRPFRDHHVQARTYGILLTNMGFDTSRLIYAIVIVDPSARVNKELRRQVFNSVIKNGLKESVLKTEDARIYIKKFNREEAEQDLDWAIEFWKKRREAIPTRNPNKCKSCEYNAECDRSHSVVAQENQ